MTVVAGEPLVSVVTPFYNTASHLRECIESVLAQTHGRIEYILQDNASTDGSTEIALEYLERDPRIRYFRLSRLVPQVENYNIALARIDSDSRYCKIVQADDWLTSDCLRNMVALAESAPNVGLISALRFDGHEVAGVGLPYTTTVLAGREAASMHLLTRRFLFGSPTTVMYRGEVVRQRQPFYQENRLNEDTDTCFDILKDWDFGFVHQILSYSRVDEDSLTGRERNKDPHFLARLIRVRRYGPVFLDPADYAAALRATEDQYYRQLARASLSSRNPSYWEFHTRNLAAEGMRIEKLKLLRAIGGELLGLAVCPRRIVEHVRDWRN